jgi:hypothetical protein
MAPTPRAMIALKNRLCRRRTTTQSVIKAKRRGSVDGDTARAEVGQASVGIGSVSRAWGSILTRGPLTSRDRPFG